MHSLYSTEVRTNQKTTRPTRSKSSDGRMVSTKGVVQDSPFVAGAVMQLQNNRFTSPRGPPLRGKGLPSGTQVNKALAAKSRSNSKSASNSQLRDSTEHDRCIGEAFVAKLAGRDDVLQVIAMRCEFNAKIPSTPASWSTRPLRSNWHAFMNSGAQWDVDNPGAYLLIFLEKKWSTSDQHVKAAPPATVAIMLSIF